MKHLLGLLALLIATTAYAQVADGWYESKEHPDYWARYQNGKIVEWMRRAPAPVPEVDKDAVLRRGDYAEHIQPGTIRNPAQVLWGQVSGPPPSDAHKWTIGVIYHPKCPTCAKLKTDWASDAELRAFAKPELENQKDSWAHFGWYDKDDASQQWRWANLKVTAYPTIIVSPPRNGEYGEPKTVVCQQTYGKGSTPSQLAKDIRQGITRYLGTLPRKAADDELAALPGSGVIAAPSPVQVKPKADPPVDVGILPADPTQHLRVPPPPPNPILPSGGFGWLPYLLGGGCCFGIFGFAVLMLVVLAFRTKPEKPVAAPGTTWGSTPAAPVPPKPNSPEDALVDALARLEAKYATEDANRVKLREAMGNFGKKEEKTDE